MMTRRKALKATGFAVASAAAIPATCAQSIVDGRFQPIFRLPTLPYSVDALEPHIDTRTMEIHHERHHATYVDNVNEALALVPGLYFSVKSKGATEMALEYLLKGLNSVPERIQMAIRNNGAGHYNHSLFWRMMKKNGGGEPKGDLAKAINRTFGSFSAFKAEFRKAALAQFGSGWAWLTLDADALKVEALPNDDNPLSLGRQVLLGLDLWEHAYYLQYQDRRADYVHAWFNVVDWDFVAERYAKAKS
jgi:Fe-Mn family superoxide dismutase